MQSLWVESHRPDTIDGYVFRDESQKKQIKKWVDEKFIPHLLLSGGPGVGKTTLARMLCNELGVHSADIMFLNASNDNSVDTIRNKVTNFAGTMPFGDFKVIILDEADYLTHNAQSVMRGLMEEYSDNCRFILTCNYPNKIIPAIHSRSQTMHIPKLDKIEFTERVATVLIEEGVEDFDIETLDAYVSATYPDLRSCINSLELNVSNGKLMPMDANSTTSTSNEDEVKIKLVALMSENKMREARKYVAEHIAMTDIDSFYRWMYENIDLWSDSEDGQDQAILIIRKGLVNHALVSDPEINFMATLIEITSIDE